jgi:antitoxin MazE
VPLTSRIDAEPREQVDVPLAGNYTVIMVDRTPVIAEIVDIGNSKGLRIPKPIREELGLEGKVTLTVAGGALMVRPKRTLRADWADRFAKAKPQCEPLLMPDDLGTDFDSEWTW